MKLLYIIIDNLINNNNIDKLFQLLESNISTNNNKKIINLKILTNSSLIIKLTENNNLLEKYIYKNELLIIYNLLTDFNKLKLNNYVKNITSYNNFDDNDSSFLLYILYNNVINYNKNINEVYIFDNFGDTCDIQKLFGFLKILEFNLDINDYIKFWMKKYLYYDYNIYEYNYCDTLFKYKSCMLKNIDVIELYKNNEFSITKITQDKLSLFYSESYNIIINISGRFNISNDSNKYYIEKKIKTCWRFKKNNILYINDIRDDPKEVLIINETIRKFLNDDDFINDKDFINDVKTINIDNDNIFNKEFYIYK